MVTISRSEEHTSELQSHSDLVCRLLLEKKKITRWLVPANRQNDLSARSPYQPGRRLVYSSSTTKVDGSAGSGTMKYSQLSFFFNDTATTEIYTLSLHDALPI